MTRILPHLQRDDTPHFVTFNTHGRWLLPLPARTIALDSCRHDHGRTMHLHIAVIMPDHVHLIFTPLVDYDRGRIYPLSQILWAIKSASAHRINKVMERLGAVWQEEYFDTAIRRSDSLDQKIEYVRQNPVRAGLVATPEDYQWSWEAPRPRAASALKIPPQ
jgi:REP element-mobilizing transposase RayT